MTSTRRIHWVTSILSAIWLSTLAPTSAHAQEQPLGPVAQRTSPPRAAPVQAAPAKSTSDVPPPEQSALDSALFYQLLVGEMSAQSGDVASAFQILLDAARKTNDARLYERSVEIALRGRAGDSALQAALAWGRAQPTSSEALRYQMQILIGLGRVSDTIEPLRRHLSQLPLADRAAAIAPLPRYFGRSNDKKLAASVLEQALNAELGSPVSGVAAWTAVGTLRLLAADATAALEAASKASALNPKASEPMQLALALINPNLPQAEALVVKYLEGNAQKEVAMGYVRKLLEAERLDDAASQLLRITQGQPDYPDAWLVRGSLELQRKQNAQAKDSLERYLRLTQKQIAAKPSGASGSGSATVENRDSQDTESRGEAQAYFMLAQIAEQAQRLDEARDYLNLITNTQDRARVQVRHANLLAKQGKLEEARALIRALPETRTDDARFKLSAEVQLLRDARAYQSVYEVLAEAARKQPQDAELLYDYGMAAEKVNQLEEMERALRQVIALRPDYHHAYNALGYSLADRKLRLDEARQLITKALEFAPDDPYILDSMAWVEYRSGNTQQALQLLQKAFKAKPDAEIAAHLGEVLWVLSQREAAITTWKQGLTLNPSNETLIETMRRFNVQ